MNTVQIRNIVSSCYSLSKLGVLDGHLAEKLGRSVVNRLESSNAQDVTNMLNAYTKANFQDDSILFPLWSWAAELMPTMQPMQIGMVAHSLSFYLVQEPHLLQALYKKISSGNSRTSLLSDLAANNELTSRVSNDYPSLFPIRQPHWKALRQQTTRGTDEVQTQQPSSSETQADRATTATRSLHKLPLCDENNRNNVVVDRRLQFRVSRAQTDSLGWQNMVHLWSCYGRLDMYWTLPTAAAAISRRQCRYQPDATAHVPLQQLPPSMPLLLGLHDLIALKERGHSHQRNAQRTTNSSSSEETVSIDAPILDYSAQTVANLGLCLGLLLATPQAALYPHLRASRQLQLSVPHDIPRSPVLHPVDTKRVELLRIGTTVHSACQILFDFLFPEIHTMMMMGCHDIQTARGSNTRSAGSSLRQSIPSESVQKLQTEVNNVDDTNNHHNSDRDKSMTEWIFLPSHRYQLLTTLLCYW